MKSQIVIRADGDSKMGLGHVVRCGALAAILNKDFTCTFYTKCRILSVIEDMRQNFSDIIQLPNDIPLQEELKLITGKLQNQDIVILDGYHFKENYQEMIRDVSQATLVCIDDIHAYSFRSSIIINSAGNISPTDYHALPQTQFYLGPAYALLRKPFFDKVKYRRKSISNKSVFICLGGADPDNSTMEVLQYLSGINKFEKFYVVVGGGYLYFDSLQQYINESALNVTLARGINANELADTMQHCSYAVCSPSTICYEYMTVGGVTYLKQIADNQRDMIQYLTKNGFSFLLDDAGKTSAQEEEISLEKQARVFDGKAGDRLKSIFNKLNLAKRVNIRQARTDDMMLCYDWANDPSVREQSFNSNSISLPDHKNWFKSKLTDKKSFFYILELESQPFAQIRFQANDGTAVLSYLVDKNYRNKGLGTTILSKGIEIFINDLGKPVDIVGYVKFLNIASQRSFEKLNFFRTEAKEYEASFKYVMHYDGNTNRK